MPCFVGAGHLCGSRGLGQSGCGSTRALPCCAVPPLLHLLHLHLLPRVPLSLQRLIKSSILLLRALRRLICLAQVRG
jgi:hypothetical protein